MNIRPVVLSEHNLLRTVEILNTGKLIDMRIGLEKELEDAVEILTTAFKNKNTNAIEHSFFVAMAETLLEQFSKEEPAVLIKFVREITNNDVYITFREVPLFRDVVMNYGQILRAARCRQGI